MDRFIMQELLQTSSNLRYIDTSSSNSDDSEEEVRRQPQRIVKINRYVEDVVSAYSLRTFQSHFRISKDIVYDLIDVYNRSLYSPVNERGVQKVSNEKAFLLSLWYLSNTETFRQVSDRFDVSLSTAHGVLLRVLNFILSLTAEYIKWPSEDEAAIISFDFKKKKGIQNIIGAVDGCHVKIIRPRKDEEVYVNRKGYHSLLIQGIVDSRKVFTDVYCGEPGSIHDARLLRRSGIFTKADDPRFFGKYFVIGDSAYPSLPWLVPPFKDNGALTQNHKTFNHKHSSTRIVIEHAFGILKGRFRRLQHLDNIDLHTSVKCIMASCILHNICMKKKDETVIVLADLSDDLISYAPPFETYVFGQNRSRREAVYSEMFNI